MFSAILMPRKEACPRRRKSASNAQHHDSGGGLNRKPTARVPFFVLQNTAYADYNASRNELLDNPYVYYQHQR